MTVARRLQSALVVFVLLLTVVAAFEVRSIQLAARSSQRLAAISSRLRLTSTEQVARVAQMQDDASKFLVTRDAEYLARAGSTERIFETELERLDSLDLSSSERSALAGLVVAWRAAAPAARRLHGLLDQPGVAAELAVSRYRAALDRVEAATQALGVTSQSAMGYELHSVERASRLAERVSLAASIGALALMILLSAHLVRAIVLPLERLAEGTRQVSAGHFDHRLEASGADELAQVARDFNAMTARLDELDRLKRDFVARVSHDLKTPLSSMQETTTAVLDGVAGPLSETQRHLLALNLESNRRLAGMLSKLLDLSRIEARLEPERDLLDLGRVVRRAADLVSGSSPAGCARVVVVEPLAQVTVRGDAHGLGQVIENLLENALKFSPPGGTVAVGSEVSPQGALLTVADEGPGIPDVEKERIFERFYQTEAGRAVRGRGAGLGLAICREIVAAHGGRIWVTDNEPRGSVFHVILPAVAAEPAIGQVAA